MKVYLDAGGKAAGDLFWDDGESIGLYCYCCYGLRHSHYHYEDQLSQTDRVSANRTDFGLSF